MGIYKLNSKSKLRYSGSIGGIKIKVRKKMLSLLLSSLILLFILPAICSANELITEKKVIIYNDTFEGESENWEAKYLSNEKHVSQLQTAKPTILGMTKAGLLLLTKATSQAFHPLKNSHTPMTQIQTAALDSHFRPQGL